MRERLAPPEASCRSGGDTNDISYGVYVNGWPVQQSLANLGAASLGILTFQALTLVLVVPFAVASWFLVERRWLPAHRPRTSSAQPAGVAG